MKGKNNFIDANKLLDLVLDVEKHIEQFKLKELEYEVLLGLLGKRLHERKIIQKKKSLQKSIPGIIEQVKANLFGG